MHSGCPPKLTFFRSGFSVIVAEAQAASETAVDETSAAAGSAGEADLAEGREASEPHAEARGGHQCDAAVQVGGEPASEPHAEARGQQCDAAVQVGGKPRPPPFQRPLRKPGVPMPPVPWSPYDREMAGYTLLPHVAAKMAPVLIGDFSDEACSPTSVGEVQSPLPAGPDEAPEQPALPCVPDAQAAAGPDSAPEAPEQPSLPCVPDAQAAAGPGLAPDPKESFKAIFKK